MNSFTPPNGPVRWLVTHIPSGQTQAVIAQTAYEAIVRICGWTFQTATAEQARV